METVFESLSYRLRQIEFKKKIAEEERELEKEKNKLLEEEKSSEEGNIEARRNTAP